MSLRTLQLKWAAKIARARFFVVLTDKEAAIVMDGVEPENIEDKLALQAQTAELRTFHDALGGLIKDHDRVLDRYYKESSDAKSAKKNPKKRSKTNAKRGSK